MRVHNKPKPYSEFTDKYNGKDINKYKLVANCSSINCNTGSDYAVTQKPGLSVKLVFCPDCGSALYWEKLPLFESIT